MTKLNTSEVRQKFIDYFVQNDHKHLKASSLIPHNDPSLLFVNSGMVQFKNIFTGQEALEHKRAVTSQKSIRAGGKHNDLENVGYTTRHHTFFEMLGNFSFGDYFKEEAIYYAWNLLTKEFRIPKDKLYATIYHTDEEAYSYWKKIANLEDSRIIRIKTSDNFWSMGDTGPCGPCSEIFYDHGPSIYGGLPGSQDQDGDRYVEIWNMVFMEFEQLSNNTRIPLPKKSIDTGMGLERIAAVMQGVNDNYDIDLFQEIINYAENILKVKPIGEAKFSYRVIADHLRSCAFLIADGIMPSNEGRGYVLRRIMRRSINHAHQLGSKEPLLYKLLPKLVDLMGTTYPELKTAEDFISNILQQEEVRFKSTLDRGLKLLDEEILHIDNKLQFSGETAFKLYDTFGFPLDLTEDILKKKNISVDIDSFNKKMQEQRDRAKKAWSGSSEAAIDKVWFDIKSEFGSTEFLGYGLNNAEGKIIALIQDNNLVQKISTIGAKFILVANQTTFYGESGGQIGDLGSIKSATSETRVIDTIKYLGSIIAHICVLERGSIATGDNANFSIDVKYRKNIRAHHSATHILHAVLHEIYGKSVTQKGSLVCNDRLRFDIAYNNSLSQKEINIIEDRVNQIVRGNYKVNTTLMSTDQAIEAGAMALFGEKYDSEVRVVSIVDTHQDAPVSFELCGGTHVERTGDIGLFKITGESSIAAGIRRIEAVCGEAAIAALRQNDDLIRSILEILKSSKIEVIDKLNNIVINQKESDKELQKLKIASIDLDIQQINSEAICIKEVKLIYKFIENLDPKIMRVGTEQLAKKLENLIVVHISDYNDKLSITVALNKNISNKFHAGNIAKEVSLFLGGSGGGGQPTIAQAGAIDKGKLDRVAHMVKNYIEKVL
jgi:alanyl-tRNA synthetase